MNVDHPAFDYISLCSGGGGLDLGLRMAVPTARCRLYVEIEAPAIALLAAHMEAGSLDAAPVWTNLRTFDGRRYRGLVDAVVGGIPCQPWSVAGKRRGAADERNLWPDTLRIIREIGPRIVFIENVGGIVRDGYERLIRPDLIEAGYISAAGIFTAEEVGAPHRRERLFILAYARERRQYDRGIEGKSTGDRPQDGIPESDGSDVGDATSHSGHRQRQTGRGRSESSDGGGTMVGSRYPQECLCERFPTHVANDCHEHNENPRHFAPLDPRAADNERWGIGCDCWKLGDTSQPGRGQVALPHRRIEETTEPIRPSLGAFPPGPSDREEWAAILAEHPDLAPATQSPLRDVVNGLAAGLARRERLAILGNGVVPQQAAYAWRCLWERLMTGGRGQRVEGARA